MSREPDETLDVLRGVWSARGQGVADLDEAAGAGKACKRMANVGFRTWPRTTPTCVPPGGTGSSVKAS